jgi:hypothetical protein
MVDHTYSIGGLETPQIQCILSKDRKVSCNTICNIVAHFIRAKERKANSSIFVMYFDEIQEKVVETWRIPPEVVEEHKDIENFQVSRTQCMDSGKKGPKEELVADEVLCHWRGSSMGYEILAR